jgi:hypothetical protein
MVTPDPNTSGRRARVAVLLSVAAIMLAAGIILSQARPTLANLTNQSPSSEVQVMAFVSADQNSWGTESQLATLSWVGGVDRAALSEFRAMDLDPDDGWRLEDARILVIVDGADRSALMAQALEIPGVQGMAYRVGERVWWETRWSQGGSIPMDSSWKAAVGSALAAPALPSILAAIAGLLAALGLAIHRSPRRAAH